MERTTFILRALPGKRDSMRGIVQSGKDTLKALAEAQGIGNFSLWGVEDMLYGYGECANAAGDMLPVYEGLAGSLAGVAEGLCAPGTMRLMYHDIGIVRQDKSLIRHRVFSTKLKSGCEEEYKRRHDGLIEARGDAVSEGPDSNFTIWFGAGYIFGYCEKVKSFDRPMTEEEKRDTITWETRQLEIMDWLTDDVDWITGQKHEAMQRLL